jgi:phosphoribosylglycinamide formyltransferase-1
MKNIAVIVSGGGSNLQALIDAISNGSVTGGQISLVIADKEGTYAEVRAKNHGIPFRIINRRELKNESFSTFAEQILAEFEIDIIVLAGFLGILSGDLVQKYPERIINVHPSLIPKYCGKGFYGIKVHEAVIAAGEKTTGATVHYVDGGIDTGKIITQSLVSVLECDTPEGLQKRVLESEWEILPKALQRVILSCKPKTKN